MPVESVSIQAHGPGSAFVPAARSADNYFLRTGDGPYQLPLAVIVTSILGDTVRDVVHASDPSTTALIRGGAQFPAHAELAVVEGGAAPTPTPFPSPVRKLSPAPTPTPRRSSTPKPVSSKAVPSPKSSPTPSSPEPCKRPLVPYGADAAALASVTLLLYTGMHMLCHDVLQ